jgi:hypothetical protein
MALLKTYSDFLERINELGFMALSSVQPGLPSLSEETPADSWHTGDADTDPWRWKDRAAEEKRCAYGCILGGHKGFVSARLYPVFYAACRPRVLMPERWSAGTVTQTTWQLWQLFEKHGSLDTSEVRRLMGVTEKSGAGRLDAGLVELQRDFYLAVAGSRRKVAKNGQPYGWPASIFMGVTAWAPPDWLNRTDALPVDVAREMILDHGETAGWKIDRQDLAKILGF